MNRDGCRRPTWGLRSPGFTSEACELYQLLKYYLQDHKPTKIEGLRLIAGFLDDAMLNAKFYSLTPNSTVLSLQLQEASPWRVIHRT